jgi:hypothetical protein
MPHGRSDDFLDEAFRGRVEHLDLQGLFGSKVSEEPALGESEIGGESPDRQPFEPNPAGERDSSFENRRPGLFSLSHAVIRARTFVFCQDQCVDAISKLLDLAGKWKGTYRLIVVPTEPVRVSESSASIAPIANRWFARIDYA